MKIILTGATGMAGEGVLFECLENRHVTDILIVGRRPYGLQHPKVKELIVPDFLNIDRHAADLKGYYACFFCAGISSIGMKEDKYTLITYTTTMAFAKAVLSQNKSMVFTYITGAGTDGTEKGRIMWARVKGKTENDLLKLGFKGVYNFRPALMVPTPGQKSLKTGLKILTTIFKYVLPASTITLKQLGRAMINVVLNGYHKSVLEVKDIKEAAGK